MTEFRATCCGIPCIIRVTDWEPYVPAKVDGLPESCYPSEGGFGDWEVLDRNGKSAKWLQRKLEANPAEVNRLEEFIFNHMES